MTPHDPTPHDPDNGFSAPSSGRAHALAALRAWCAVEAATLLALLFVAVPMKHLGGHAMAVSVMGPIHGFAFLAFGWLVVRTVAGGDLSKPAGAKLMLAACLPFGGLYSWWALR